MRVLRDILLLMLLLGASIFIIYLIEGKKFKIENLLSTPEPTSTKSIYDKTDSVLVLVDKKIVEVDSIKRDNESTIDSLKIKIQNKDYKSKSELLNLKKQISSIEKTRDSISQSVVQVHKAYAIRRPDTVYVVKHIIDTIYLTNLVLVHDTLQLEPTSKLKRLKAKK